MEAPDIISHGVRLNAVFYLASGKGPHPTVLLMHGFPGNEKNLDLAYAVRRAGWNVLFPHYRGAWGSGGSFSFSNAIEDTQAAIQFLRDPANVKKYRIDPKRVVLVGHSMGGFMVAYAGAHDPEAAGVVMISAWNIGKTMSERESPRRHELFVESSPRLAGTTPEGMEAEAKQNASKWNYDDWVDALKTRPVLILESHDETVKDNKAMAQAFQKAGATRVTETYMETDHSFGDHRIALQVAVINWLQGTFPPAAK
jgi:acetyl esterase/lipase